MSIRTFAARGLSFAHLAGITSRAARAEDDDRREDDERAEDDEMEDQDDRDNSDSKGKKGRRAEDRKEDAPDADDDRDDDAGNGTKGRRAEDDDRREDDERAEDDDRDPDAEDDEGEMRGKSSAARARRREQARCAAIMGSKAAARNPVLAANLAFKTRMTRAEAIETLEGTPAPASAVHSNRAARNPSLGGDGGAKPSRQQALAARWDANLQAANPTRR